MKIAFVYPHLLWFLLLIPLTAGLAIIGPRRPTRSRFWGGLALRLVLLALVVLALAGIQLRLRSDTLTAVFLLDVSDSIPQVEQTRGEELIRQSILKMPHGDQAAVVVFGQDALVERLAAEDNTLADLASVPITFRTDIASALQLGLALFPDEGAKRLVLFSDGRENLGHALDQAELAAVQDIQLTFISLQAPEGQVEVLVESLDSPADVRQGQRFDLTVVINSTASVGATLRVFGDGQLIYSQQVHLQTGTNRFLVPVEPGEVGTAGSVGFRRFEAQILPDADTRLQNNSASAFTVVHGPPSILLVEGNPEDGKSLSEALISAEMSVTAIALSDLPTTLPELAAYDAVILANVPAPLLPSGVMEALQVYVRDLGKGLLMVGGQDSFGAGGYLRTPLEETLPVYMDVRSRELSANLALVLVVDKSGSMGRCHCDNPDLNQTYTRTEIGQPKVDIAKSAVMRAASALGSQDYLGVVAFDASAHWSVNVNRMTDFAGLEQAIGSIVANGQTNVYTGLEAAFEALQKVNARRKHIILLTDGWTRSGDFRPLAQQMKEQGITLSVVAAGGGSAEYLKDMADAGGGRYYAAQDMLQVPDFFLKETVKAVGQYIIEEAFYPLPSLPGPALRGIDPTTLPALLGYNGTSPKNTARIDLATPRGDPLMATWQYGLGHAAAWTSDLKNQWATEWVGWQNYPRFVAQLVGWLLPVPQVEGLVGQASIENGRIVVRLTASDKDGNPRNYVDALATLIGTGDKSPGYKIQEVRLAQVGAGQYEASLDISEPGTYLIRLGANQGDQSLGQQTLGLVVPYSPEYKAGGTDLALLDELAGVTGGSQLTDPLAVFLHNLPTADFSREIWRPLLFIVVLLFPLDVAVRRVMLGAADFSKAVEWVKDRLPFRRYQGSARTPVLGRLFEARARARQRRGHTHESQTVTLRSKADANRSGQSDLIPDTSSDDTLSKDKTGTVEKPPVRPGVGRGKGREKESNTSSTPEETLTRLRDAKKRARRGE